MVHTQYEPLLSYVTCVTDKNQIPWHPQRHRLRRVEPQQRRVARRQLQRPGTSGQGAVQGVLAEGEQPRVFTGTQLSLVVVAHKLVSADYTNIAPLIGIVHQYCFSGTRFEHRFKQASGGSCEPTCPPEGHSPDQGLSVQDGAAGGAVCAARERACRRYLQADDGD